MTAVLLALLSAIAYGTSDFLGGLASRRAPFTQVALIVQVSAAVSVLCVVPFTGGHLTSGAAGWGALSGLGGGTGATALYRGLARGQMSVAGSISGVGAAGVPVIGGLALGERPSLITLAGIAAILPAVFLIAREPSSPTSPGAGPARATGGLVEGVVAGLGFGLFFLALSRAGPHVGLWPTAASEVTSSTLVAGFCAAASRRQRESQGSLRGAWPGAVGSGLTAAAAIVLYLLATRRGLLVVVAVLAALYPAATVLLARVVVRERSSRSQAVGLIMAAAAIVAITAG